MKAGETTLQKLLNTSRQFIVPIYQRSYSWEKEQYSQLWRDVLQAGSFEAGQTHFIGSVVYIDAGTPAGRPQQLMLIDGQQRLATLSLLICALRRCLEQKRLPSRLLNPAKLGNQFLFNADETDEDRYKLLLGGQDRKTYISLLNKTEYTLSEPSTRLMECWLFFNRELAEHLGELELIYRGILKLSLVSISLDKNTDNPQRIFESMNSTGKDLSQADLLRNFFLMDLDIHEQKRLYTTYWQPMEKSFGQKLYPDRFDYFLRDFLTIERGGGICRINDVYEVFKRFYAAGSQTKETLLKKLFIYARYYTFIMLDKEPDRELNALWRQIKAVDSGVSLPFLLQLYRDYDRDILAKADLISMVQMTVSYLVRRALCYLPSNALSRVFASLYIKLDKNSYAGSLAKLYITMGDSSIFPTDYQVRENLLSRDVYHFRLRDYLLQSLENHHHKEPIDFEAAKYSVEHIMPQNSELNADWQAMLGQNWQEVQKLYLHTLGNLTLTGYNSELSDKSFEQKQNGPAGFKRSHLLLNRYPAQCSKWDKEEIIKRTHLLTDAVLSIWQYPDCKK